MRGGYGLVAAGALGIWLGIQAVRAQTLQLVWNVAEDQAAARLGLVAVAMWAPGFVGWVVARAVGGRDVAWRLGLLFAATTLLRQTLWGELATAVFAVAAWIAWLWWLPAYLRELARRAGPALAAATVLIALAVEVASQAALHGLELHALSGLSGTILGAIVVVAFVVALRGALRTEPPPPPPLANAAWGALALGPFLALQLTLLLNTARLELSSSWPPQAVTAIVALSLALALVALARPVPRPVAVAAGVVSAALLAAYPRLGDVAIVTTVPIQIGLALLLAAAFAPPATRSLGRAYLGAAGGAGLLFVLLFTFHSALPVAEVWPIAALALTGIALRASATEGLAARRPVVAALALAAIALLAAYVPAPAPAPAQAAQEIRVLNYNIHQGVDRFGVPNVAAVADVIAASNADVVALQEVNRGWDVSGGVDTLAYLRWRFPTYRAVFGPMHAEHFGNAILSRHPVVDWGWARFPLGASALPRGYVWARLALPSGELTVVTTHLTPYDRGDERTERGSQAQSLVTFWQSRPRTVIVGDFNDAPDSPAVTALVAAGFVDALAAQGVGTQPTYVFSGSPFTPGHTEKLDYIFATKDLRVDEARILDATASDHLPLAARLTLR